MNKINRVSAFVLFLAIWTVLLLVSPAPKVARAQGTANAQYLYIVSATTTTVDAQAGFLQTVTINGGVAGTITLYDIAGPGCTGTPASGKFGIIEAIGATNPTTLIYNLKTKNGLCIVTAAATDITVTYN